MRKKKVEEVLKNVCDGIIDGGDKELFELKQPDLERHWFFIYDYSQSYESNMYEFYNLLKLYEHFCERWENHHNGYVCIVERVRDKYLMPKIKEFLKAVAVGTVAQQTHGEICSCGSKRETILRYICPNCKKEVV